MNLELKMNKKKKLLKIATILLIVGVIASIVSYVVMQNQPLDYKEVNATVISARRKTVKSGKSYKNVNEVKVLYDSKTYELKNVTNLSKYSYRDVKVYLYNGDLYANVNGILTSTWVAYVYFAFLFITSAIFVFFIYCVIDYSKFKKVIVNNYNKVIS